MSLLTRIFSWGRLRRLKRELASDPSPITYLALAQYHALAGNGRDAEQVCEEGLSSFPENLPLAQFLQRVQRTEREKRLGALRRELALAPRPALWRELCEALIESDELGRAEEEAQRWLATDRSAEARYLLARVKLARFYADRGREQGRNALACLEEAERGLPGDARVLRTRLEFLMKIGAWQNARDCAARLLAQEPGSLELEGRYRTLQALVEGAPTIERALHAVEKSGKFADESEQLASPGSRSVQPILRELASSPDIRAALYVRGATALVQGPKGATAERTARAVQSILASSRAAARKLGLGQTFQIQLEGVFGTLSIAPGEQDAGALLCSGPLGRRREEALFGLAGLNAETEQGGAS